MNNTLNHLRAWSRSVLTLTLILLLFVAMTPAKAQSAREVTTVRYIARTLDRLGETKLAKRFIADFTQKHLIFFADLKGKGVNAETGKSITAPWNTMTLSSEMLRTADAERIVALKPYGDSSRLVMDSVTVFHEYFHMGQNNPKNESKFEDPAWKATEAAISKWVSRLVTEARNDKTTTAELQSISDLLAALRSECGSMTEAIQKNKDAGVMTKSLPFGFNAIQTRIDKAQEFLHGRIAVQTKKAKAPAASKKCWVLVQVVDEFAKNKDAPPTLSLIAADGSISCGWKIDNHAFKFMSSWSGIPKQFSPSDTLTLNMDVSVVENVGNDMFATGSFSVWFDRFDNVPGYVISPIRFSDQRGTSTLEVNYRGENKAEDLHRVFKLSPPNLPAGAEGKKIALLATGTLLGYGVGIKYIYEWKTP